MSPAFVKKHWNKFSKIPHVTAGAGGAVPATWVKKHDITAIPKRLSNYLLDRNQGGAGRGSQHVESAWTEKEELTKHLTALRTGGPSRSEAYNLFVGKGSIKGIGPAYWTKLIYFFTPTSNFYIMDQWTGKSINLLTGRQVVRMQGDAASGDNKCGNYQAYCEEIDAIAGILKLPGDNVEEMLMSSMGSPWRTHVKKEYDYNPDMLRDFYSHIPNQNF